MRQTTLCVPLEVKPQSGARLAELLTELRDHEDADEGAGLGNFSRLQVELPAAHFLSLSVFSHASYDPLLVIEANFDGEPGPFWAQFERAFRCSLRDILRCCKRPCDGTGALHDAVTAEGSRAPIAPYLERRTQRPSVSHQGNRGMTRDRIRAEAQVAEALEEELDGDPGYRAMAPSAIHRALRGKMLEHFGWLADPPPRDGSRREQAADWAKVILFASVVAAALLLPGALLAAALSGPLYFGVLAILALVAYVAFRREGGVSGLPLDALSGLPWGKVALVLAALVLAAAVVLYSVPALATLVLAAFGHAGLGDLWPLFVAIFRATVLSVVSLVPVALGLAWALRWNERRDSLRDAPSIDERTLSDIARLEDRVVQNHMGSIVLIRPGVLRSVIIRIGHRGLHLVLRALPQARKGYLGTMRTVHFAHWAFLNNDSRLLFLSNYDHSWDSYLDDFIEKAHGGLTLAWGCGIGFPETLWLVLGGAQDGRRFKSWALASRTVSRFWYSAYPNLTVNRIHRHAAVVEELRLARINDEERAAAWLRLI